MKNRIFTTLLDRADNIVSLFYPRCCPVCGNNLSRGEKVFCLRCNIGLPRTNFHLQPDNPVEKLFWGKVQVERAASFFFYTKGSAYQRILQQMKYGDDQELGMEVGACLAAELLPTGFFDGIDLLLPVPLHARRLAQRGYNQSACLARGIASVVHLPVDTHSVVRSRHTESQTHKTVFERWENVEDVFTLRSPELFRGKHVLLVDDVLTTGATTVACAKAFDGIEGVKISVMTLAVAQQ